MSETLFAIIVVFEILIVLFVIWGILNEKKLIKFERKAWKFIKELFDNQVMEFVVGK